MRRQRHRVDPEGQRLPIKLDSTSNGEFLPVPLLCTVTFGAPMNVGSETQAEFLERARQALLVLGPATHEDAERSEQWSRNSKC